MSTWTPPAGSSRVAYDAVGSGLPLVLVHAFPLSREMFAPQLAGLADVARVVAPDLPGFGGSDPTGPWSVDSAADRLAEFLTGVGVTGPAVVGGVSMGGYVALAFARRHPGRLRGLLLADTRAEPDGPEAKANREKTIALARDQGAAAVFAGMKPKVFSPTTLADRPDVVAATERIAAAQPGDAVALAAEALRDRPDARPDLAAVAVPTLVVVGEDDAVTPPDAALALVAGIRGATLEVIPRAGHLSNLEAPAAFNAAVCKFLGRIG